MSKEYHRKQNQNQRGRSKAKQADPEVLQLSFDRASVIAQLQEGLHQVGVEVGLQIAALLLEEEAERLCGPWYQHDRERNARRHGFQHGVVTIAGQKVRIERPRVRSMDGKEVRLSMYEQAQNENAMPKAVLKRAVCGVSNRDYERVIDAASEGFGVKRSSVSRAFVSASAKKIDELFERRLDDVRFPAIFIDGVAYADTMMIVALGLAEDGSKRVLGFREGRTENAVVCKALLEDLIERGLSSERATLFVIDGSKALRNAITSIWGSRALVQRCRAHKKRNIEAHVPDKHWPEVRTMLAEAWQEPDADRALKRLKTLAAWLDRLAPDAARSLREGLEETITITRLGIDPDLAVHLHTTNPIESAFSATARLTGRVKRWRDGAMKRRWCATGLLEAEKRFRRIKGFRGMSTLLAALDRFEKNLSGVRQSA